MKRILMMVLWVLTKNNINVVLEVLELVISEENSFQEKFRNNKINVTNSIVGYIEGGYISYENLSGKFYTSYVDDIEGTMELLCNIENEFFEILLIIAEYSSNSYTGKLNPDQELAIDEYIDKCNLVCSCLMKPSPNLDWTPTKINWTSYTIECRTLIPKCVCCKHLQEREGRTRKDCNCVIQWLPLAAGGTVAGAGS